MCKCAFILCMVLVVASPQIAFPGQAPKVIQTIPPADAVDVDPSLDHISVAFDIPIKQNSHSLVALGDLKAPELVGDEPVSFPDNKTCVIKVKFQANTAYGIGLNSKARKGFKSAKDGTPAIPFELRFKTGASAKEGAIRGPAEPESPVEKEGKPSTEDGAGNASVGKVEKASGPNGPGDSAKIPQGWVLMDDRLFGTQVGGPARLDPPRPGGCGFVCGAGRGPKGGGLLRADAAQGKGEAG